MELLARYGDPTHNELPLGLRSDINADMSFTGLKTAISSSFHVQTEDKLIPLYEREMKNLNFEQILYQSASIQFACIYQMKSKVDLSLHWLKSKGIPYNALNLCGGVSCNGKLREIMGDIAQSHELPMVYNTPSLCTDNAAMIAWMGWELINAQQDVCIRDVQFNA